MADITFIFIPDLAGENKLRLATTSQLTILEQCLTENTELFYSKK